MTMFKCSGDCKACGRCKNIFPNQVEKSILFPEGAFDELGSKTVVVNSEISSKNLEGELSDNCSLSNEVPFENLEDKSSRYGIAFDIGTTTVAAALWNLDTKEKIHTIGGVNPQREYGADVLSRISFCMGSLEKHKMLQYPLLKTFEKMTIELLALREISIEQVEKCVFCGNTTMTLLFAGLSIDGLSKYPFTPSKTLEMDFDFVVEGYKIPSIIMAGISGHIGGDISASLLASGMTMDNKNAILLDLGTNGEVICKIDGMLYGFSTAAGPAFEGANISCGTSATVGAIDNFKITDNQISYHLIGEHSGKPFGICGTGLMSLISEMLKAKIINIHGDFSSWDDYKRLFPYNGVCDYIGDQKIIIVNGKTSSDVTNHGVTNSGVTNSESVPLKNVKNIDEDIDVGREISMTQQDVRQMQMAKAAILAGIKVLFNQIDVSADSIETVYLAGGFSRITPEVLNCLNIFPFDVSGKLKCIGNGALTGASMVLLSEKYRKESRDFSHLVERIELGEMPEFQREFLDSFDFRTHF